MWVCRCGVVIVCVNMSRRLGGRLVPPVTSEERADRLEASAAFGGRAVPVLLAKKQKKKALVIHTLRQRL